MTTFEIIPKELAEQIIFYQKKLKQYEKQAKELVKNNYEIPSRLLSQGVNASAMIRNLKIRQKGLHV